MSKLSVRLDRFPRGWFVTAVVAICLTGCDALWLDSSPPVRVDGSSTVYLITESVAEELLEERPGFRVTVGICGTGGGFKKFAAGGIDICDASREIKDIEREACAAAGIDFVELEVAYDGIAVVVSEKNDWLKTLTVEQLRRLWEPESTVRRWSDLNPEWPDAEVKLFGPGTDSGTFDYFTEAIVGKSGACRPDFTASEDDNMLARGIAEEPYGLGYFGLAYYIENIGQLRAVPISDGGRRVAPSPETVRNGTYQPLSRPLFIYVNEHSLARPAVAEFVEFYLDHTIRLAPEVGFVAIPEDAVERNRRALSIAQIAGHER